MNSIRNVLGVASILVGVALCGVAIEAKLSRSINEIDNSVANLLTERDSPPGFDYAINPREFEFPTDHGAHPSFRSEWWYFTGHVSAEEDQTYGFEMTIFRFGLNSKRSRDRTPNQTPLDTQSPWRGTDLFMGHLAIIDPQTETYWTQEVRSRSALNLAGAATNQRDGTMIVWINDWEIEYQHDRSNQWRVEAMTDTQGLAFQLEESRSIVLQGENGLSRKSLRPGNASYYYSIPRLAVNGILKIDGKEKQVTGEAWLDREWGTSALDENQRGWDWFGLQLSDGTEVMYYQIRERDNLPSPSNHGSLITNNGNDVVALSDDVSLTPLGYWRSQITGANYPIKWHMKSDTHQMNFIIEAEFDDQQWTDSFVYWEGMVSVAGTRDGRPVSGRGFLEMTGYD